MQDQARAGLYYTQCQTAQCVHVSMCLWATVSLECGYALKSGALPTDLERVCGPDCILSTNTSTIDIELIGAKTKSQDRVIGAHFFSPAHIMPLLEIVRTSKTSKQVILRPDTRAACNVLRCRRCISCVINLLAALALHTTVLHS